MESIMIALNRFVLPVINAFVITGALIYAMFLLIESPQLELKKQQVYDLEWVQLPEDNDPIVKSIIPVKPKKIEPQPIIVRHTLDPEVEVHVPTIQISQIPIDNGSLKIPKNNQLALSFGLPPVYSPRLINRGIEGYVVVGFSVNQVGDVFDPFVIESEPKGVFDKAALEAIAKFKYKPRYEDDRAVSTAGQRYIFKFELDK